MKPRFLTLVALIGLVLPHMGAAQELSAEELEALFKSQKTRGLVIAPSGAAAATDETRGNPDLPSVETGAASTTHIQLPKDQQVNIQISFDFDSAALRADQKPKLATLCQVMQGIDVQLFRIVGHTDAAGSADYNQRLSLLRAEEVKRHLVGDCGIAATRLEAVGVGEQFPYNEQNPRADENRRVEFQALS